MATVTKYTGLALAPFVLLVTFLTTLTAEGRRWRQNFPQAVLRGGVATLVFAGLLLGGYHFWGSGIAVGVKFTTTGRKALDPTSTPVLLESLFYDVGLAFALAHWRNAAHAPSARLGQGHAICDDARRAGQSFRPVPSESTSSCHSTSTLPSVGYSMLSLQRLPWTGRSVDAAALLWRQLRSSGCS